MNTVTIQLSETDYTILKLEEPQRMTWLIVCPGAQAMLSTDSLKPLAYSSYAEAQGTINALNDRAGLAKLFPGGIPAPKTVPMLLPFVARREEYPKKVLTGPKESAKVVLKRKSGNKGSDK